jgi:hypothetical protein
MSTAFGWVNTMLGNLKTALAGTCHSFDYANLAARYLAEFAWRFNRRFDLTALLPRLLCSAATTHSRIPEQFCGCLRQASSQSRLLA